MTRSDAGVSIPRKRGPRAHSQPSDIVTLNDPRSVPRECPMTQATKPLQTTPARTPPEDGDRHRDVRQDDQDPAGHRRAARAPSQVRQDAQDAAPICHAHDEANTSHMGDVVEIMETRPLSKLKRWRIVRIVRPAPSRPWPARTRAERAALTRKPSYRIGRPANRDRRPRIDPDQSKLSRRLNAAGPEQRKVVLP